MYKHFKAFHTFGLLRKGGITAFWCSSQTFQTEESKLKGSSETAAFTVALETAVEDSK